MKSIIACAILVAAVSAAAAAGFKDERGSAKSMPAAFREITAPGGLEPGGKPKVAIERRSATLTNNKVEIIRPAVRGDIAAIIAKTAKDPKPSEAGVSSTANKPAHADKAPIPAESGTGKSATERSSPVQPKSANPGERDIAREERASR